MFLVLLLCSSVLYIPLFLLLCSTTYIMILYFLPFSSGPYVQYMKKFAEFQLLQKVISATAQNWPNFSHISHKFFYHHDSRERDWRERVKRSSSGDKYHRNIPAKRSLCGPISTTCVIMEWRFNRIKGIIFCDEIIMLKIVIWGVYPVEN